MSIALVTAPIAEPISLADLKFQLDMPQAADPTLDPKLYTLIHAARRDCESYTKRALVTQTWMLRRDSFPGHNYRYEWNGYPQIEIPKEPFQSIDFFQYVDVAGAVQTLTRDTSYGANPANPQYGYQLERGSETQAGRVLPPFARPWPPTRMVPSNVVLQFRCGYGGPVTVNMTAGSAALTVVSGNPSSFNPDDAPQVAGESGTRVFVPGAGPVVNSQPTDLQTFIASVDGSGNATLATAAATAVANAAGWVGEWVPTDLKMSILFLAQFYFEQGAVLDQAIPRIVNNLRDPYRIL